MVGFLNYGKGKNGRVRNGMGTNSIEYGRGNYFVASTFRIICPQDEALSLVNCCWGTIGVNAPF